MFAITEINASALSWFSGWRSNTYYYRFALYLTEYNLLLMVSCWCRIAEVQPKLSGGCKVRTCRQTVAVESESSMLATSLETQYVALF